MKTCFTFLLAFAFVAASSQPLIVPQPAKISFGKEKLILTENTPVYADAMAQKSASFFRDYVGRFYNLNLKFKSVFKRADGIVFHINPDLDSLSEEGYRLNVNGRNATITAKNDTGVFYGMQTLIQLITVDSLTGQIYIPSVEIEDQPQMHYRGMHLDVARHFFSIEYLKKYIDLLALHKLNNLHLHLTDDQGWRIEIKKYPRLTTVGSCRDQTLVGRFGSDIYDGKQHCGFYTQDQIRDLVKYAADRYINIIPEIDVPGHALAALAAYPFLGCTKGPYKVRETWAVQPEVFCAGNDSTYKFLEDVFDEVMQLFPSKLIHIGGDEAPKERWKACSFCQQKIKDESLRNEAGLQRYFVHRIKNYITAHGKKVVAWDEVLEGNVDTSVAIMSWRGTKGGIAAAKSGHQVIMMPDEPLYFNFSQTKNEDSVTQGGYNSLESVYSFRLPELGNNLKYISGIAGGMWTEYVSNPAKLEYMLLPRLSAFSEAAWSDSSVKNFSRFTNQLPQLFSRYELWNLNFSTAWYDLQPEVVTENDSVKWKIESRRPGKIIYVKSNTQNASYEYRKPITIDRSGTWGAALTDSSHRMISNWIWQEFCLNKATGKPVVLSAAPNQKYAGAGGSTLTDGIQNRLGMLKSSQFLGFINSDLEAVIDLKEKSAISLISVHFFEQKPSWIYRPAYVNVYTSDDGFSFKEAQLQDITGMKNLVYNFSTTGLSRFLKVSAKNIGTIPPGEPGAGSKGWIFCDEIEVY